MKKTCRRNRRNRRGGWSLKFWKKKPKYKKQQITNQERREYSAALETAAHANTKPTIISRDAQQGQKHQTQKLAERKARRTKELARTRGLRNLRKQMIEKSGRAGQNGGFRKRKSRRRKRRKSKKRRRRTRRKRRRRTRRCRNRRGGTPPVGEILNDKEMIQYKRLKEHNAVGGPHFFIQCTECKAPNYFSGTWKPHTAFMWRCGNCKRLDGAQHWTDPEIGGGGGGGGGNNNNSWEVINTPQTDLRSPKKKERKRDQAKKALGSAGSALARVLGGAASAVGTVLKLPDKSLKKARQKARQKRARDFAIRTSHDDASLADSFRSTSSDVFIG